MGGIVVPQRTISQGHTTAPTIIDQPTYNPVTMNDGSTRYRNSTNQWMPSGFEPTPPDPTAQEYGTGGTLPVSFAQNPTGSSAIGDDAFNRQQEMLLADKLQRDRLSSISGMFSGGNVAREEYTGPGVDETAARNAAFARAKEQAGSTARASLRSLQGVIDERGMTGSSTEAGLAGGAIGGAANTVGDFTREQLIQDLTRAGQIADMRYQGNITQRGQDLSRNQSLAGLLVGAAY
jgi:hypothetical protein